MKVAIQGSRNFNDYNVFLRAMRVVLSEIERNGDKELTIYSAGAVVTNQHATEFTNVAERTMKSLGLKTKLIKIPAGWLEENMSDMDYFAYFCAEKEKVSPLVQVADDLQVDAGIFRF
jgi:hypothetical protein